MIQKLNILAKIAIFALLFYLLYALLPHQLFFHEQQTLFRFDGAFFCDSFATIGGAVDYFGAFVAQFFKIEWLGALLFAALLTGLSFWIARLISARSPMRFDLLNLALIPVALQVALFTKTTYTFELLFALYATVAAYSLWRLCGRNWVVGVILVVGLYPLVGLYFVWFGLLALWEQPHWWRRAVGASCIAVVPLVWALVYFRPIAACYLPTENWVWYGLCYWALIWGGVPHLRCAKKSWIRVLWAGSLFVWLAVGFMGLVARYDVREKRMIEIDRALKQEQWEAVIQQSERFAEPNLMVAYARNLALSMLGQLPEQLFDVPQRHGVNGLFIGRKGNQRQMAYMDLVYAHLGLYNEAHRQAWESMTTLGPSASNISKIVRYNLLMGRTAVAQRFDRLLDHTLFYRGTLDRLQTQTPLVPSFESDAARAHFTNVEHIGADLNYMFRHGGANKRVADYLLVALLLNNKVSTFGQYLPAALQYYPKQLPLVYQQGLILWRARFGSDQLPQELAERISPQAEDQYARYVSAHQAGGSALRQFAKTYYFYIHFVSPYGSKIARQ